MTLGIALRVDDAHFTVSRRDRLDVGGRQRAELVGRADAVPIPVPPDPEAREGRVARIHPSVSVCVQRPKGLEPVLRFQTIDEQRVVAEQLPPRIDPTIPISVEHQQAVIRPDPAGLLRESVAVVIEERGQLERSRLHAIAIEIEDYRTRIDGAGGVELSGHTVDGMRRPRLQGDGDEASFPAPIRAQVQGHHGRRESE